MNKIFLIPLISLLTACNSRNNDKVVNDKQKLAVEALKDTTTVQLIDSVYNFGTITEGEKVEYSFRFKNSGQKPLVIINVVASCGCTVPEKPEKPIMPGETGFIKVIFNSQGKPGHNTKSVTVTSNAFPPFTDLILEGNINSKGN